MIGRFASGYQAQTPDGQRHLHARAEIFLPGIESGFFFQGAVVNSTLDHSVRISTR